MNAIILEPLVTVEAMGNAHAKQVIKEIIAISALVDTITTGMVHARVGQILHLLVN